MSNPTAAANKIAKPSRLKSTFVKSQTVKINEMTDAAMPNGAMNFASGAPVRKRKTGSDAHVVA